MKNKNTFKHFSEKGYKHYTENTIEELDKLPLDSSDIITEFSHLCEWLRINHSIWVNTITEDNKWSYGIYKTVNSYGVLSTENLIFNSPQEAYSAAFDYILNNNLI
jgi:hypothetical protein